MRRAPISHNSSDQPAGIAVWLAVAAGPFLLAFNSSTAKAQYLPYAYWKTNSASTTCSDMNSTTPGWANLVAYWKFNGSPGAIANGATVTATVGPNGTVGNANGTGMSYAYGQINQGIIFDGTDDYIQGSDATFPTGSSAQSFCAWAYTNVTANAHALFTTGTSGSGTGPGISFGVVSADLYFGSYDYQDFNFTDFWEIGKTHHVCYTYDGTTIKLYGDGSLLTSKSVSLNVTPNMYRIGWNIDNSAEYWNGGIDEAALWNTTLSAGQIQALYDSQKGSCNSAENYYLAFTTTAQSVSRGLCSGATTIQTRNSGGSPLTAWNATVNLSGPAGVSFYSDANCSTPITAVQVTGGSSGTFYFTSSSTGTKTITATSGSHTATQNETINAYGFVWTGGGGNANWTTGANWSGGVAPGPTDTAVFDGTCSSNCSPTINTTPLSLAGLRTAANYSGTITQGAGNSIIVDTAGWVQLGGNFIGSSSAMVISGNFRVATGASFTSTSGSLILSPVGPNLFSAGSGSFIHNGGTVAIDLTNTATTALSISANGTTFKNLTLTGGYGDWLSLGGGTITVLGSLIIDSSAGTGNLENGTILSYGTVIAANGGMDGSAVVQLAGNASGQTVSGSTGAYIPNLTVAAGSNNVTLSGTVAVYGDFILNSVGTFTGTGTTLNVGGSYTINSGSYSTFNRPDTLGLGRQDATSDGNVIFVNAGTLNYNNVTFYGHYATTFDLGANILKVNGTLTFAGQFVANSTQVNNGTIEARGNVTSSNFGAGGSVIVQLMGNAGGQTITGISAAPMPGITISVGANAVTLSGFVWTTRDFTVHSVGTLSATGATLKVGNSYVIDPVSYSLYNVPATLELGCAYDGDGCDATTYSVTAQSLNYNNVTFHGGWTTVMDLGGSTLNVNGNLTFDSRFGAGYSFVLNGAINVKGNLASTNFGNTGTVTITLNGTSTQTISFAAGGGFPDGNITINNSAGVTLANNISFNSTGQVTNVVAGNVTMSGKNWTLKSLTLNGNTVTKGGGVLKVNGATAGTGSLFGGTVNP